VADDGRNSYSEPDKTAYYHRQAQWLIVRETDASIQQMILSWGHAVHIINVECIIAVIVRGSDHHTVLRVLVLLKP